MDDSFINTRSFMFVIVLVSQLSSCPQKKKQKTIVRYGANQATTMIAKLIPISNLYGFFVTHLWRLAETQATITLSSYFVNVCTTYMSLIYFNNAIIQKLLLFSRVV